MLGAFTTNRYGSIVAHPAITIERHSRLALARLPRDLTLPAAAAARSLDDILGIDERARPYAEALAHTASAITPQLDG